MTAKTSVQVYWCGVSRLFVSNWPLISHVDLLLGASICTLMEAPEANIRSMIETGRHALNRAGTIHLYVRIEIIPGS